MIRFAKHFIICLFLVSCGFQSIYVSDKPDFSFNKSNASYKFIQKLWVLHEKIKDKINNKSNNLELENNFERFVNETISKFDHNL